MTTPYQNSQVVTRYDRYVAAMRISLPAAAVTIALVTFLWPLTNSTDISFVLSRQSMQRGADEVRIVGPVYRGTDSRDRSFRLSAREAVQPSPDAERVLLETLSAEMALRPDRTATATATRGVYDKKASTVEVPSAVRLVTSDGYDLEAGSALIDLGSRTLRSDAPVAGRSPLGEISADRFTFDVDARKAVFDGNVRLYTTPAPRD